MILKLVTVHGIVVDSVASNIWESNKGGIYDIESTNHGVRIHWLMGSTFVPWSNVRYVQER